MNTAKLYKTHRYRFSFFFHFFLFLSFRLCRDTVSFRERVQVRVHPLTSRALNKQTLGLSWGLWEFALRVVSNSIRLLELKIVACK